MLTHTEWRTEAHMISYLVWFPVKKNIAVLYERL